MTAIQLRRSNTATPWGFRLNGGVDLEQPLYIQRVIPNGLAHRGNLQVGDGVIQIGQFSTVGMTHNDAKMTIIRCGNELDLVVNRNVVPVPKSGATSPMPTSPLCLSPDQESWRSPSTPLQDPNLQSRSFKLLQQSLSSK